MSYWRWSPALGTLVRTGDKELAKNPFPELKKLASNHALGKETNTLPLPPSPPALSPTQAELHDRTL